MPFTIRVTMLFVQGTIRVTNKKDFYQCRLPEAVTIDKERHATS